MYQSVLTEVDAGVGIVTLNRPERHNALDETLIGELRAALAAMEADPAVRVVVLSGNGKSFCAGADVAWMHRAAAQPPEDNLRDARGLAELLSALARLPKPTLARVHGPAYGGGVGLVAACDVAVAAFDAQFALSEVKLGIIPSVIGPHVIAAMGERHARRYMLTAERFAAAEAYRIGLVHEIVADQGALDLAIGEMVLALLGNGPMALGACKALIQEIAGKPLDDALLDLTARRIAEIRASGEAQEGLGAFLAKRRPAWAAA